MQTIIETPTFIDSAKKLLSSEQVEEIKSLLAADPKAGAVMAGTGGFRKIRIAREGGGKSGGFRIIYFLYNESIPVFLFTVYAKNAQENLTKAQRNTLAKIAEAYQAYGKE